MPIELSPTLLNTKVGDLERPSYLVSLSPFDKLIDAISQLTSSNISSALVRTAEFANSHHSNNASHFCGVIDLFDIVAFYSKSNTGSISNILEKHTVADLITDKDLTLRYAQTSDSTTIQNCAKLLAPGKNQRLLVIDDDFTIVNIITQTSLLQFVAKSLTKNNIYNESKLLLDTPLSSILVERQDPTSKHPMKIPLIDPTPNSLYSIKHNQPAIDAFNIMYKHHVSGVCVVDATTGTLLGNISQRDIRTLLSIEQQATDKLEKLSSTAFQYLQHIKEQRANNASRVYIKMEQYESLHNANHSGEEIVIDSNASVTTHDKEVPPLPKNTVLEHAYCTFNAHASLPQVLTISGNDTVGFLISLLATKRVRRVYITSGHLRQSGYTAQLPVSIITLSDIMDIFSGEASTLSF